MTREKLTPEQWIMIAAVGVLLILMLVLAKMK